MTTTIADRTRQVRIIISRNGLTASMVLSAPGPQQDLISIDEVQDRLKEAGVVHGIDWEAVRAALRERGYNNPIKIASGTRPRKGRAAIVDYYFEPQRDLTPEEGEDGRIDYRSMHFIHNVNEGDILASKILPTPGVDGTAVDGRPIKAQRGRDIPFSGGSGTRVSADGRKLIAAISGAVVYARGSVFVDDVTTIYGDVDMGVGNIDCVGSVRVAGEVHAGFTLRIGGNLEVGGNVHDCSIYCKGNILVKGGCFGKRDGIIQAEGDIVVKYAEGQNLVSRNDVIVGGELMNCRIQADGRVMVKGRRGTIVGGAIVAGSGIRASVVGSEVGTRTHLQVLCDTDIWNKYHQTISEMERLKKNSLRVKAALYELYRLQVDGKLPPEKEEVVARLEEFRHTSPEEAERLADQKADLEAQLSELGEKSIIVDDTVYPGTIVQFGPVYREVSEALHGCKFTLTGNRIISSAYYGDSALSL